MLRRTKIVATLGPASDDPDVLRQMIEAGLNVVRINFSHGEAGDHRKRVAALREIARQCDAKGECGFDSDSDGCDCSRCIFG